MIIHKNKKSLSTGGKASILFSKTPKYLHFKGRNGDSKVAVRNKNVFSHRTLYYKYLHLVLIKLF